MNIGQFVGFVASFDLARAGVYDTALPRFLKLDRGSTHRAAFRVNLLPGFNDVLGNF